MESLVNKRYVVVFEFGNDNLGFFFKDLLKLLLIGFLLIVLFFW